MRPFIYTETMRRYLQTYREAYVSTADEFLDDEARRLLTKYKWLRTGRAVGYISSDGSCGFELATADSPVTEVHRSVQPVTDQLFGLAPKAMTVLPTAISQEAGPMHISGPKLTFRNMYPFRFRGPSASVTLTEITLK